MPLFLLIFAQFIPGLYVRTAHISSKKQEKAEDVFMSTYTPAMLLHWLSDAVLDSRSGTPQPHCTGGIKLLDEQNTPLRAECLYIGSAQNTDRAALCGRFPAEEGILILASGRCRETMPSNVTLIELDLPLLELYNRAQENIHRFLAWDASLRDVVYRNAGLQELLQRAFTEMEATLILVNTGYKHIASVYHPNVHDCTADELQQKGYHSTETVHSIRHSVPIRRGPQHEFVEYVSSVSNNYTIVWLIRYEGTLAARLCFILNGPEANACYSDLSAIVAEYVSEYMFSNQGVDYGSNADFGSLAADLIECRLTDPQELEQRLKQIKLAVRRYYHVVLVSFEGDQERTRNPIPWNYVISQLEQIFPFSNTTTYQGEILMIVRKTKRSSRLPFNQQRLLEVLERYNGYIAIGNTSEYLTSLSPVYHQTRDAMRLGRAMDSEQRIFYYENYSMYHIIEMASEAARQRLCSRNPVHLCNNEAIAVLLYDKKTGGNLLEFLYHYLLHERNATETAKALYIHRNTALYKIHKIEEIIGSTLDDPILRERLLFSYHVLEYVTKYRKEDLLTLKRSRSEDYADTSQR